MARIPGVPTLEPVAQPLTSPGQAAKVGEAVAGMGDVGQDNAMMEWKIRAAQEKVDGLAANNQMNMAYAQIQDQLAKTTNSRDVADVIQQGNDSLNDIAKQWSKSPASVSIQQDADSLRPSLQHVGNVKTVDLQVKEGTAQAAIQMQTYIPALVTATRNGDKGMADLVNSRISQVYGDLNKSGLMSDADMEKTLNAVQIQVRQQLNEAVILSDNPQERTAAHNQLKGNSGTETMVDANPRGLIESGNLPIWSRPTVQNDDGTHSTEYTTSFNVDGKEVLLPTVVNGKFLTPDGKKPREGSAAEKAMFQEALQHYRDTGENLGKFDNAADADSYSENLHNRGDVRPSSNGPLNLTGLGAGDIAALRMHADTENNRLIHLAEAGNLNTSLNIMHNAFQAPEYRDNYEARQNALEGKDSDEWLVQHHITNADGTPDRVMASKLMSEVNQERAEKDKIIQDKTKTAIENYGSQADDLKITDAQIDNRVNLYRADPHNPEGITPEAGEALRARRRSAMRFSNSMAAAQRNANSTEDAIEYGRIRNMDVNNPESIEKAINTSPLLKPTTRKSLMNWTMSVQDHAVKSGLSQAEKFLTSQIMPTGSGIITPIQRQRSAAANQELQHWIDLEKGLASSGKRPPLQPAEIYQQATQIAPYYIPTMVERITSMREQSHPIAQKTAETSQAQPEVGHVKTFPNGKKGRWDGSGYVAQ